MGRASGEVVGRAVYTFDPKTGRPVDVEVTIRLPAGRERAARKEASRAERKAAIVAAAEAGLPQKAIADDWGISQSKVSRILTGKPHKRVNARRISRRLPKP